MKKAFWIAVIVALTFVFLGAGLEQENMPKLRQEIVKLKYIDKEEIRLVLSTFLSPYGRISPTEKSGLLTISDIPENVEKILAVVRELDVKPADIQFSIQLILASAEADPGRSEELVRDDPLIKELRSLLSFKFFYPLDSSFVRALDGEYSEVTMGPEAELKLALRPKHIREDKEDIIQVETRLSKIIPVAYAPGATETRSPYSSITLLTSNFTMKSGEKTVVGVSKLDGGDKGLILIITGKIVK
ncbi:MAG: secretin N-terminal domain-containing protein [Candidatus Aminicenantales bacterium]